MLSRRPLARRLRPALMTLAVMALIGAVASAGALAGGPAHKKKSASFETEFLSETIDHHFSALKMGELCAQKATLDELKAICADIVAAQSSEIQLMQGYLADWYGIQKEPGLSPADQQMLAELAAAEEDEFNIMISEGFIEHHKLQVRRSKSCLRRAYHSELKDLCREQIEIQSREIQQFKSILCDNYGLRCGRKGRHRDDDDHAERHHGDHDRRHGHHGASPQHHEGAGQGEHGRGQRDA